MPRGRKPKPPKLKVVTGDPGGRGVPTNPRPSPAPPQCPDWLPAVAVAEWDRVVPELQAMGLLARADQAVLTAYCQQWAVLELAQADISRSGVTYETDTGRKRNPAVAIADAAAKQLRLLASELGLTPVARQRLDVGAEAGAEPDELENFNREQRGG